MVEGHRLLLGTALALWAGLTLVLSEIRWFRRTPLTRRLQAFAGSSTSHQATTPKSSFSELLKPFAVFVGERISRFLGVGDDLSTRLRRAGSSVDPVSFRSRQLAWAFAGLAVSVLVVAAIRPPALLTLLIVAGAPILGFLVLEQQIQAGSQRHQKRLFNELPIFGEQLAMLLGAGYSLGSALNRVSERGSGVISSDLVAVCERVRQGLTVGDALREWADVVDVTELTRMVGVLALSSETSDLGRLVSDEARNVRQETQRRLAETIDRRNQQVWVPVTVATLIPGVIFLTIPFLQALRVFAVD